MYTLSQDAVAINDDRFTFTNLPYSLGLLEFLLGLLLLTEHVSLLDFTTFTPSCSGKDNFTINKNTSRFWIIHWLKRRNFNWRNIIKALLKRFCLSMVTLRFYPDSKLRSALYRKINCQHHQKVLISSFHVQTQKLKKHNFKIKTLSLRIYKRRAGQETHVLSKMYLTFLDHNALCSFIKDMIPPVKTKLVSSIITNLHTKWNECQSN